jgi:hypothetical protein
VGNHNEQSDDRTALYPVLADEPVEMRRPRRKARLIAASFAAAILLTGASAYAGTTYAIHRSEWGLRQAREQFAADLEQRRQQRDDEQEAMQRDLCTVVTRLPADAETDAMRRKYECGPFVVGEPAGDSALGAQQPSPRTGQTAQAPSSPAPGHDRSPAQRPEPSRQNPPPAQRTTPPGQNPPLGQNPPPGQKPPPGQNPPPGGQPTPTVEPPNDPGGGLHVCLPLLGCLL